MKTNSPFRVVLALVILAAITAVLSTNAQAGNRRLNNPPNVNSSNNAPVVSLP